MFSIKKEFPVDTLPDVIRKAVLGVEYIVQCPAEMAGQGILAAANFAVQAHVDVDMPVYGARPVNEFFVTIGATGERKSGVDRLVLAGVQAWQDDQFATWEARKAEAQEALEAWETARKEAGKPKRKAVPPVVQRAPKARPVGDILADLRNREGTQFDREDDGDVIEIEHAPAEAVTTDDKPLLPLYPKRLVREPTVEGLCKVFRDGYPALGMFNDEAASFLSGYAMAKDNALRTVGILSDLWDGKPVERVRGGDELGQMPGRRLNLHLMVQPAIAPKVVDNPMFAAQGFSARLLVAYPATKVGTRLHRRGGDVHKLDAQARLDLGAFTRRVRRLLDTEPRTAEGDRQHLKPRLIGFTPEARDLWYDWTDAVEMACGLGGVLAPIVGLGVKAGEHVGRLAATLAVFDNLKAEDIGVEHVQAGIALMEYYLGQALGVIGQLPVEDETSRDFEDLEKFIREWPEDYITYSLISQYGPGRIRKRKDVVGKVINHMVKMGVLNPIQDAVEVKGQTRKNVYQIER